MRSPKKPRNQINVAVPDDLFDAIKRHLGSPLLLTLPKGALATFVESALRRELQRLGVPCTTESKPISSLTTESPDLF